MRYTHRRYLVGTSRILFFLFPFFLLVAKTRGTRSFLGWVLELLAGDDGATGMNSVKSV